MGVAAPVAPSVPGRQQLLGFVVGAPARADRVVNHRDRPRRGVVPRLGPVLAGDDRAAQAAQRNPALRGVASTAAAPPLAHPERRLPLSHRPATSAPRGRAGWNVPAFRPWANL